MSNNTTNTSVRLTSATIACDWCSAACRRDQITLMSGAKLCQGCAPYYHGDGDDEGEDEDEKKKRKRG